MNNFCRSNNDAIENIRERVELMRSRRHVGGLDTYIEDVDTLLAEIERLRQERDDQREWEQDATSENNDLRARLDAVLALHPKEWYRTGDQGEPMYRCGKCSRRGLTPWPCVTVRAATGEEKDR